MLDVHASITTPGAVLVLGAVSAVIAGGGDGASVAGVPIAGGARLRQWGFLSPTADTIAAIRLQSQDMPDPLNGCAYVPGAASLLLNFIDYADLPYKTGLRGITVGTNTGVVAGAGILIDEYDTPACFAGNKYSPNIVVPTALTYGAATVANTWGTVAFAPAIALPTGKYAILGWICSAVLQAVIRFQHADFQGRSPGGFVCNYETAAATTFDTNDKDILNMQHGNQFVQMGQELGKPCCPVFTVGNAGTGLSIQIIAAQAVTPVVTLVLQKVA